MAGKKKYTTASGFRMALEERLKNKHKKTGMDLMRLRRQISFDRFLARIFSSGVTGLIAKGGYTLELRLNQARTTKDIDFAFTGNLNGVWTGEPEDLQIFLNNIAQIDLGDFFLFSVGTASLDLENAVYGGFRFPIEAKMAGKRFSQFSIDIAGGDAWIEPHEKISTHDWFDFADIPPVEIPIISLEQQFVEKLHSYTLKREHPNSRVKDIVDMVLLIKQVEMSKDNLNQIAQATFTKRNTHSFPPTLNQPPESWQKQFPAYAKQCNIKETLEQAFELVRSYCESAKLIA